MCEGDVNKVVLWGVSTQNDDKFSEVFLSFDDALDFAKKNATEENRMVVFKLPTNC